MSQSKYNVILGYLKALPLIRFKNKLNDILILKFNPWLRAIKGATLINYQIADRRDAD